MGSGTPGAGGPMQQVQQIPHANAARRGAQYQQQAVQFSLYDYSSTATTISREPSFVPTLVEEKSNEVPSIKNVWYDNFEDELPIISELLEKFPYIAMVRKIISYYAYIGC